MGGNIQNSAEKAAEAKVENAVGALSPNRMNNSNRPIAGSSRIEPDYVWMPIALKKKGIPETTVKLATDYHMQQGRRVSYANVLVDLGIQAPEDIAELVAAYHNLETVNLGGGYRIPPEIAKILPANTARRKKVVPIARDGQHATLAVADPSEPGFSEVTQMLSRVGVRSFTFKIALEAEIIGRLEEIWAPKVDVSDPSKFFDLLVADAVYMGVSDIHLVPEETHLQIKFRIDGFIHPYRVVDAANKEAVIARFKIKGGLDIAVRNVPQDGRAKLVFASKKVNLRFSSLPTLYGESIVMRILDQSKGIVPLTKLGMLDDTKTTILKAANAAYGFTYFVGPTGSGKTTSLYSIINTLDVTNYTMMTLEDPIEYEFRNIRQTEITDQMTFASGLRALLRQDPDYILVGETRDHETAELSMRAALTGHTGFSTLHANTALGGIARLIDMGVEPSIIISAVNLFVSQRLVRRLCTCKEIHPQSEALAKHYSIKLGEGQHIYRPKPGGCGICNGGGYKGRVGLYECRPVEAFSDIIVQLGKDAIRNCEIKARELYAKEMEEQGSSIFRIMRREGFLKVAMGQTSIEEVVAQTEPETGFVSPNNHN